MLEYRRSHAAGGVYFFTVVTYNRLPILTTNEGRALLRSAWIDVQVRFPFTMTEFCLLPDHPHCIWSLLEGDADFSVRWKEIKRLFTKGYLVQVGPGAQRNESRLNRGEAAVWQSQFWEHTIRDQQDLNRHIEYLHYNTVKHGLVERVVYWPWSSFHRYVKIGFYDPEWGGALNQEVKGMACGE
jgi:putative transposase